MKGTVFAGIIFSKDWENYKKICEICQGYIVGIMDANEGEFSISLNGDPFYIKEKISAVEKYMTGLVFKDPGFRVTMSYPY